jgi:prophage regulatory protein
VRVANALCCVLVREESRFTVSEQVIDVSTEVFLALNAVRELVGGLSRAMLYKLIGRGEFPKPMPLAGTRVFWLESDVRRWMKERLEAAGRKAVTA